MASAFLPQRVGALGSGALGLVGVPLIVILGMLLGDYGMGEGAQRGNEQGEAEQGDGRWRNLLHEFVSEATPLGAAIGR